MSKLTYSGGIDEDVVVEGELDAHFTSITAAAASLDMESFREKSIRYRHLDKPPVRFLWDEKVGSAIGVALTKAGAWNTTAVRLVNISSSKPFAVYIEYEAHNWQPLAYEIAIGYEHGGAYFALPGTERVLGPRHTSTTGVAYNAYVNHYYTGAAGWTPTGMARQPVIGSNTVVTNDSLALPVHTVAGIGEYVLMIRVNNAPFAGGTLDIRPFDVARIWGVVCP